MIKYIISMWAQMIFLNLLACQEICTILLNFYVWHTLQVDPTAWCVICLVKLEHKTVAVIKVFICVGFGRCCHRSVLLLS